MSYFQCKKREHSYPTLTYAPGRNEKKKETLTFDVGNGAPNGNSLTDMCRHRPVPFSAILTALYQIVVKEVQIV